MGLPAGRHYLIGNNNYYDEVGVSLTARRWGFLSENNKNIIIAIRTLDKLFSHSHTLTPCCGVDIYKLRRAPSLDIDMHVHPISIVSLMVGMRC